MLAAEENLGLFNERMSMISGTCVPDKSASKQKMWYSAWGLSDGEWLNKREIHASLTLFNDVMKMRYTWYGDTYQMCLEGQRNKTKQWSNV